MRRGVVTDWAALERILYDALYMKVPTAVHVLTIGTGIIHFPYCILNTHMGMVQGAISRQYMLPCSWVGRWGRRATF